MRKISPKELAKDLLLRSDHYTFQLGAVIVDVRGRIISWGWNTCNRGIGSRLSGHAEALAIRRANRKRLKGASIFVAGRARNTGSSITAKPCKNCQKILQHFGIVDVYFTTKSGEFLHLDLVDEYFTIAKSK